MSKLPKCQQKMSVNVRENINSLSRDTDLNNSRNMNKYKEKMNNTTVKPHSLTLCITFIGQCPNAGICQVPVILKMSGKNVRENVSEMSKWNVKNQQNVKKKCHCC